MTTATNTFDPTKPVRTRDGREAEILSTTRPGAYPIVAAITYDDDEEAVYTFQANGECPYSDGADDLDLVNVPEDVTYYANFYTDGVGCKYLTIKEAVDFGHFDKRRLGMLEITYRPLPNGYSDPVSVRMI